MANANPNPNQNPNRNPHRTPTLTLTLTLTQTFVTAYPDGRPHDAFLTTSDTVVHDDFADEDVLPVPEYQPWVLRLGQ